ncbi:MAG: hypothetical protein NTW03_06915 [Verrucomicrobia bacterium]|nr:hypothetical protein [Verrucomicrobiota bacterium]
MNALAGDNSVAVETTNTLANYTLDYSTPCDPILQARLEATDARLRALLGMTTNQTAVGVLDLRNLRLAMIHPDRIDYAASVAKIGILLAYFQLHREAATNLSSRVRHELGLMIKASDYILVALTCHPAGDTYLSALAGEVDDLMSGPKPPP